MSTKKNTTDTSENDFLLEEGQYKYHKKYFSTPKGKKARRRAEKAYDQKDIERRRKQKRDYMRRKRLKDPDIWRY